MRFGLLVLLALLSASTIDAANPGGERGTVSGRVVFSGDLNSEAVKKRVAPRQVYERVTLRQSASGIRGRKIADVPNRSFLVDDASRGLANVFVFVRPQANTKQRKINTKPQKHVLTFEDNQYSPRAIALQVGDELQLRNADPAQTALFKTEFMRNTMVHLAVDPLKQRSILPAESEKIPCRVNNPACTTAEAWVMVTDHPYASVTENDGTFKLGRLPPGNHTLTFWHEAIGYIKKELSIEVSPDKAIELELLIDQIDHPNPVVLERTKATTANDRSRLPGG